MGDLQQRVRFVVAEVEHRTGLDATLRCGASRQRQGNDDIVDVQAIAQLLAIAEHRQRLAAQHATYEHGKEAEPGFLQILPGAVHVRQPQGDGSHAVHRAVQPVVLLAGKLVDTIDVARVGGVCFVDRQVARPPVHLARARVHDHCPRADTPDRFQEHQLRSNVDVVVA